MTDITEVQLLDVVEEIENSLTAEGVGQERIEHLEIDALCLSSEVGNRTRLYYLQTLRMLIKSDLY